MAKTFKFDIITPDGIVFSGEVESLRAPGTAGGLGILADHAPFMTTTTIGIVEVVDGIGDRKRHFFAAGGGFMEVLENSVLMLVETAETAENIDLERAKAALQRARNRLQSHSPDIDILRAQSALHRALNRIKTAELI